MSSAREVRPALQNQAGVKICGYKHSNDFSQAILISLARRIAAMSTLHAVLYTFHAFVVCWQELMGASECRDRRECTMRTLYYALAQFLPEAEHLHVQRRPRRCPQTPHHHNHHPGQHYNAVNVLSRVFRSLLKGICSRYKQRKMLGCS